MKFVILARPSGEKGRAPRWCRAFRAANGSPPRGPRQCSSDSPIAGLTTYDYNALGERIVKRNNNGVTRFVYDEEGKLLGEYDEFGVLIQETVWLGNIPVATLRKVGGAIVPYYVHADHLGTPRYVTRPSDNAIVWRWDSDPFGKAAPDQNPIAAGEFRYNARFPGQYFDEETGLHYNYFRDYEPALGRYIQSDPIGLAGGLNTYLYANNAPMSYVDPRGAFVVNVAAAGVGAAIGATANGLITYLNGGDVSDIAYSAFTGAVGGAVAGATLGATGTIVVGAAASGLASAVDQAITEGKIDLCEVAVSGVVGGAGGSVGLLVRAAGARAGYTALHEVLFSSSTVAGTQLLIDRGNALSARYPANRGSVH